MTTKYPVDPITFSAELFRRLLASDMASQLAHDVPLSCSALCICLVGDADMHCVEVIITPDVNSSYRIPYCEAPRLRFRPEWGPYVQESWAQIFSAVPSHGRGTATGWRNQYIEWCAGAQHEECGDDHDTHPGKCLRWWYRTISFMCLGTVGRCDAELRYHSWSQHSRRNVNIIVPVSCCLFD